MAKVLVTGGAGFVGRVLVDSLLVRGDDVTVVYRKELPNPKVRAVKADLTVQGELARSLSGEAFDVVYHTASLPVDIGKPLEMVSTNVLGLTSLLEYARKSGIKRVVVSGSVSAYGWFPGIPFVEPDYLPIDEQHRCKSRDMYTVTKLMQEQLCTAYHCQYGLETVILRLTSVIGPKGSGGGRLWADLAAQFRDGKRVQLPFFREEEVAHFVDVRDVAEAHIRAAEVEGMGGEAFNIAARKPTTGREFADVVIGLLPRAQISFGYDWSLAQGNEIYFSTQKAAKKLGFLAKYDIEDSVRSIWEEAITK